MISDKDKDLYLSTRNQSTDQVGEYIYNAWFPVKDVVISPQLIGMFHHYSIMEYGIRTVRFEQK